MKEKLKTKKGITLIALVITIIVLLILAGVAIASLTGENGILNKSKQAAKEYEYQQAREEIILAVNSAKMTQESTKGKTFKEALKEEFNKEPLKTNNTTDIETATNKVTGTNRGIYKYEIDLNSGEIIKEEQIGGGQTPIPPPTEKPGKPNDQGIFTESSTIDGGTKGAYNPTVPKGFKPIETATSSWGDGTKAPTQANVNEGLVIQDSHGNEFVWIPVDGNNPFQRRQGYYNGSLQDISNFAELDSTGNNSKVEENQEIKQEAIAMYASVATNGGFYIGRYEAGIESDTPRQEGAPITADRVVVQKNKNVYNYVGWSNSRTMTVITGGAVELARNFATQQGYDTSKVHSTLCYGVQWDTALNFIDPGYTGYAKNSTGKGNYDESQNTNSWKGKVTTTGASENYKVKNIYDMAGNVYEWTMESHGTDRRAVRGGYYGINGGLSFPASNRSYYYPGNPSSGFVPDRQTYEEFRFPHNTLFVTLNAVKTEI